MASFLLGLQVSEHPAIQTGEDRLLSVDGPAKPLWESHLSATARVLLGHRLTAASIGFGALFLSSAGVIRGETYCRMAQRSW